MAASEKELVASGIIFSNPLQASFRDTDAPITVQLANVVREALRPFPAGTMTVEIETWSSTYPGERVMWVEVKALPGYPFKFRFDELLLNSGYVASDQAVFQAVAKDLFDHFRYRPALAVDDHIVLGED